VTVAMQCPWRIHWGVGQESTTQCGRDRHIGDPEHRGMHDNPASPNGKMMISWRAGDRREYVGPWPGPCSKTPGCVLHTGHRGRCAT